MTTEKQVPDEMTKDKSVAQGSVPEYTEEQKEYARINVRKQFNENFSKWAHIADENATDEDIEIAKQDYQKAIDETKEMTYVIATAEGDCANRAAGILYKWNKEMVHWKNGTWRGVIAFNKYIRNIIKELDEDKSKDLVIDYSTLCYLYTNMAEPSGIGLDSAYLMADLEYFDTETNEVKETEYPVTYSGILEKVCSEVQKLTNIDKKLLILRERVNLAYAGLKMELKISELEEFIEFADAINTHTVSREMEEEKSK